ncbi:YggS family pyridoxal phosphate-dependent enzyme [Caldithrix abyssi]|uniref:Pyridoxal phosphate homeostasis protein n=1 Tax=Caldithrix abyssi DSM 13497 TaxID=880073 RepID=H1XQV8_CALAY|nr:YggS family pyridoxal phosphate-dependent enzyme [Caldithrix abyssi]APF18370.1 hypothetical protein Cabys_1621 [Caldithrix abyssi DSM 13497]EHO42381.1 protein of unknown function UPF0001 [Caldithrix abyssi DSM 13497]
MENLIKDAIARIYERIEAACQRAGRSREEITLVAVSKTMPPEVIKQAYDAGLRVFGENRPQELRDKARLLPEDIQWHFIGHLQTNKIKYVAPRAVLIHSVDSLRLAEALDQFAEKRSLTIPVLLEVNVSGESSKFGFAPEKTPEAFEKIAGLKHLHIKGLMTIGPLSDDRQKIRQAFRQLYNLREDLQKTASGVELPVLSMGMSGDFEIAIEEGSTHIRIGTAIFGARGRQP